MGVVDEYITYIDLYDYMFDLYDYMVVKLI